MATILNLCVYRAPQVGPDWAAAERYLQQLRPDQVDEGIDLALQDTELAGAIDSAEAVAAHLPALRVQLSEDLAAVRGLLDQADLDGRQHVLGLEMDGQRLYLRGGTFSTTGGAMLDREAQQVNARFERLDWAGVLQAAGLDVL